MRHIYTIFEFDVSLHKDTNWDSRSGKGYQDNFLSLILYDLICQHSYGIGNRLRIMFQRIMIYLHILICRNILNRQHLAVMFPGLNQFLPHFGRLRFYQPGNILVLHPDSIYQRFLTLLYFRESVTINTLSYFPIS